MNKKAREALRSAKDAFSPPEEVQFWRCDDFACEHGTENPCDRHDKGKGYKCYAPRTLRGEELVEGVETHWMEILKEKGFRGVHTIVAEGQGGVGRDPKQLSRELARLEQQC